MLAFTTKDVQWLSVNGTNIAVETRSKAELAESMQTYFEDCKSCRSEIVNLISSNNWVNATEIASWESKGSRKSQSALSVYEFENALIKRVYYFPAEVIE